MRLQILTGRANPAKPSSNPEDLLRRADALFHDEQSKDLQGVIAEKLEQLRHYDVLAMDRVAAILMWGRSGSLLLASYLDGHEDVMMLPELYGWKLHEFFERFRPLPLRDKLLAYPVFDLGYNRFFDGDFAVSSEQYYAAVQALVELYGTWPSEFLESRRTFFLFVHIAYNLALGRRPASSNPLIVYAQHWRDNTVARHLVEDFPRTKFVHTVRDPISSCDAFFRYHIEASSELLAHSVLYDLINKDRPHSGMEARTRTVRFEDLHRHADKTVGDLSDWLGLPYQSTLLESTFNGIPYVVKRDGKAWSGPRLEQIQRSSMYLSLKDRGLLYALFYQNFADWNYPCPKIFRHAIVRLAVFGSLLLAPMKMEGINARKVFKRKMLPALRRGNIWRATKPLLRIAFCRLKIIHLLSPVFFRRLVYRTTLLQVDLKTRFPEQRDAGADGAARSETPCGRS